MIIKMEHTCKKCGYTTTKYSNLVRHMSRKRPCVTDNSENVTDNSENVTDDSKNVTDDSKNVTDDSNHVCQACKKTFSSNRTLMEHKKICNGVSSRTCEVCLKTFSSRNGKYKHKKNVKCVPVNNPNNSQITNITNNNNNNNITNNNNNNITNNVNSNNTININVNVFGKEDLSYLLEDTDIIEKIKRFGKSGIYGLSKIIDDVHFNKDKPENSTLIKPEEHGNGVMIMNDDKEWEFREFEDIRDNLLDTVKIYMKAYNVIKKSLGIELVEDKEREIVRKFAYQFMALDAVIPNELFQELNMNDEEIETDEEEIRSKIRKFDKSTLKNIHNRTITNYKKENGTYIKK